MMSGFLNGQAGPERTVPMHTQISFLAKVLGSAGYMKFACRPDLILVPEVACLGFKFFLFFMQYRESILARYNTMKFGES